jgi:FKBP12-rapamycin complex-associated protein
MPEEPVALDGSSRRVNRLLSGLRSNIEEEVYAAAGQLQQLLCAELHTLGTAGANLLLEDLWQRIADALCAHEPTDKKGLLLAVAILVSVDVDAAGWRCSRAANLLRSQMPLDSDSSQLVAYAIGRTAISSGPMSVSYVDFEASRAFELLIEDEHEFKRQLGLEVLRELALATPNAFVKHVNRFLESVFPLLIGSPNKGLQDSACQALQAVFGVVCVKETIDRQVIFFRICLSNSLKTLESAQTSTAARTTAKDKLFRDDRVYGALLALDELLICADATGEQLRARLENSLYDQHVFESPRSQYQVARQWGGTSNTQCLREYVRKSACGYTTDPLELLLDYHLETGLRPNALPPVRSIQPASSSHCRALVTEYLERISRLVLREKESTNSHVQKMLLRLLPRLTKFNQHLSGTFFQESIQHVLASCSRRCKERSSALLALGLISASAGSKIGAFVDRIVNTLKAHLQPRDMFSRKKLPSIEPAVLQCIQLLAQVPEFKDKMYDLLDSLLTSELSPALADTLFVICERIPSLKRFVQDKLFLVLFHLLFRKRFVHSGSPLPSLSIPLLNTSMSSSLYASTLTSNQNLSTFAFNLSAGHSSFSFSSSQVPSSITTLKPIPVDEPQHAMLALRMLTRFDFRYQLVMQLFLHKLHAFLLCEPVELRLEAIRCCVRLLGPLLAEFNARFSFNLVNMIQQVMHQLLLLAVADPQPEVRYTVLSLLRPTFDVFLTQTQHLERLFVCLNDELFEVRELAVCVIGRLCEHNPAFVRPRLRDLLTELLCDLQSDAAPQFREQHTRLLAHIIQSAPSMAAIYADVLLEVLGTGLRIPDPSTSYLVGSLHALGLLSRVLGYRMRVHFDRMLPSLLELVQDSSHSLRREIGLWSLGQIIDQAGCVVDPYWKYKNLLDVLLNVLRTEHSPFVRREAIKVLGLLGAVDPYEHKINIGLIDQSGTDYMADAGASLSDLQGTFLFNNFFFVKALKTKELILISIFFRFKFC